MAQKTTWTKDYEEVDVTVNILPHEYKDSKPLCTSEAKFLLEQHMKENGAPNEDDALEEIYTNVLAFTRATSKFSSHEGISAARGKLEALNVFNDFEVVQLLNVCPQDAEEAYTLVPSIRGRLQVQVLNKLLEDINHCRGDKLTKMK